MGLCPFHSEKTPSFNVNDDEGFYHCFGCGVSGDAINFLRETRGLNFVDAIRELASIAGISMPEIGPIDKAKQERQSKFLSCIDLATFFFQSNLKTMIPDVPFKDAKEVKENFKV